MYGIGCGIHKSRQLRIACAAANHLPVIHERICGYFSTHHPINASFESISKRNLDNACLNKHLAQLYIHCLDNRFNYRHKFLIRHYHKPVDALVCKYGRIVLGKLSRLRLASALICGLLGGRSLILRQIASRTLLRRLVLVLLAGALRIRRVSDKVINHVGNFFSLGILEAIDFDDRIGRSLHIELFDNLVEEIHIRLLGYDNKLIGALVGKNKYLAANHAAIGVGDIHNQRSIALGCRLRRRLVASEQPACERTRSLRGGSIDLFAALPLLLFLRLLNDRLQRGFDVVGRGVLDLPNEDILHNRRGDINRLGNLKHPIDVLLGVGSKNRIGTLEDEQNAAIGLETLKRLLCLFGGNILKRNHHRDNPPRIGKFSLRIHNKRNTFLAHILARQSANKLLAIRLKVDAVHLQHHFDSLKPLGIGESLLGLVFERDSRLGSGRIDENGLADHFAVDLVDHLNRSRFKRPTVRATGRGSFSAALRLCSRLRFAAGRRRRSALTKPRESTQCARPLLLRFNGKCRYRRQKHQHNFKNF